MGRIKKVILIFIASLFILGCEPMGLKLTVMDLVDPEEWKELEEMPIKGEQADDYFGKSVAISDDYIIVGAYRAPSGGNEGAVYIYEKSSGGSWKLDDELTSGEVDGGFGISVDIDGNYAIAGACFESIVFNTEGAAYIFKKVGSTWSQDHKYGGSDDFEYFGCSVGISNNYVVIGAEGYDDPFSYMGCIYTSYHNGSSWQGLTRYNASDAAENDYFGYSVGISGEYIIVGAPYHDIAVNGNEGKVYIFKRAGVSSWIEISGQVLDEPVSGNRLGHSVAISADYAVAGAPFNNNAVCEIYKDFDGGISKTSISGPDEFGYSVDTYSYYVIIGSKEEDSEKGAAYIYRKIGGSWVFIKRLTASDGSAGDRFGSSVAIFGDYAVVGAERYDSNRGAIYIYHLE